MAETTTEKAASAARALGEEIREKGEAAAKAATEHVKQVRDEAYARGESYRDVAAREADKVANALRRASHDLMDGSAQERWVGQIAGGVADAADRVRGMSISEVARETDTFARRHPVAFLGGAALVGFAAARFLKASSQEEEPLPLPPATGTAPGSDIER